MEQNTSSSCNSYSSKLLKFCSIQETLYGRHRKSGKLISRDLVSNSSITSDIMNCFVITRRVAEVFAYVKDIWKRPSQRITKILIQGKKRSLILMKKLISVCLTWMKLR